LRGRAVGSLGERLVYSRRSLSKPPAAGTATTTAAGCEKPAAPITVPGRVRGSEASTEGTAAASASTRKEEPLPSSGESVSARSERAVGSGRPDLNRGPLVPQTSALTRLRHAP